LPGRFLCFAAKAGALGHGACLAAVLDPAVLGVVDRLAKAAVGGFFINLGAQRLFAAAHHVDDRFLAAHQLAHHGVDEAFFNQRLQSFRRFHGRILRLGLRTA
jgi:hypothetical protein